MKFSGIVESTFPVLALVGDYSQVQRPVVAGVAGLQGEEVHVMEHLVEQTLHTSMLSIMAALTRQWKSVPSLLASRTPILSSFPLLKGCPGSCSTSTRR